MDPLAGQPPAIAVFPIRDRVVHRCVEPDLVKIISGHITKGIHCLRLPASADDLVFKMRPGFRFESAFEIGIRPVQRKRLRRIPVSEGRDIADDIGSARGTIHGGDDAEPDLTHRFNVADHFSAAKPGFRARGTWNRPLV